MGPINRVSPADCSIGYECTAGLWAQRSPERRVSNRSGSWTGSFRSRPVLVRSGYNRMQGVVRINRIEDYGGVTRFVHWVQKGVEVVKPENRHKISIHWFRRLEYRAVPFADESPLRLWVTIFSFHRHSGLGRLGKITESIWPQFFFVCSHPSVFVPLLSSVLKCCLRFRLKFIGISRRFMRQARLITFVGARESPAA